MMTLLRIQQCQGPDGCGRDRAIIWQADCGCWVFKCLICGNVDEARCREDKEHRDAFDEDAMDFVGEYSSI